MNNSLYESRKEELFSKNRQRITFNDYIPKSSLEGTMRSRDYIPFSWYISKVLIGTHHMEQRLHLISVVYLQSPRWEDLWGGKVTFSLLVYKCNMASTYITKDWVHPTGAPTTQKAQRHKVRLAKKLGVSNRSIDMKSQRHEICLAKRPGASKSGPTTQWA